MAQVNGWTVQAPRDAFVFSSDDQQRVLVVRGDNILAQISPNGSSGYFINSRETIYIDPENKNIFVSEYPD